MSQPYNDFNKDGVVDNKDLRDYQEHLRRIELSTSTEEGQKLDGIITSMEPGEDEIPGGMTTVSVLVVVSFLCFLIFIFGVLSMLKKRNRPVEQVYSSAVPGRHVMIDDKDINCLNCRLIEMGSMACYQEFCPQCGRPPPR